MTDNYARAVRTLAAAAAVNHARTADNERRYAVTVNGATRYTDSPANVARWTRGGLVGSVTDREAGGEQ